MRFEKSYIPKIIFWCSLASIALFVLALAYRDVRDTRGDSNDCASNGAEVTAYLVLNELEPSSRRIKKAQLLLSDFDPATDRLRIDSVAREKPSAPSVTPAKTPSTDKSYRQLLNVSPIPPVSPVPSASPNSSPTPVPSASPASSGTADPWREISVPYQSQPFFYPFEAYTLDLRIRLERNAKAIPLRLEVINYIDELIATPCAAHYSFEKAGENNLPLNLRGNAFSIVLKRHRFVRAIAIIIYSVAVIFLFYLTTREETVKVLTNSLGYLAALWGIRQIIMGYARLFPTAIDFVTLALYVSVVAIIVYKLLFSRKSASPRPLRRRRLRP